MMYTNEKEFEYLSTTYHKMLNADVVKLANLIYDKMNCFYLDQMLDNMMQYDANVNCYCGYRHTLQEKFDVVCAYFSFNDFCNYFFNDADAWQMTEICSYCSEF